jgi:hypothetical protein
MKTGCTLIHTCCPFAAVLFILPAVVDAQSDFNYRNNDGAITITGYTGSESAVVIPDTINGLPVTTIGREAFLQCPSLESVAIPGSVTGIGEHAFGWCTSLASITFPGSVTSIGNYAFQYTSLTNVTIPQSVTSIGYEAFYSCPNLAGVTIPCSVTNIGGLAFYNCNNLNMIKVDASNPVYSSLAGVLLSQDQMTLIQFPGGISGTYTIPDGLTTIGAAAFAQCRNLAGVTIPNSVTRIGRLAFYRCSTLTNLTIPKSVTDIGSHAFSSCPNLKGVYFQGDVPCIGLDIFSGDDGLTVYYLPETKGWGTMFANRPAMPANP